MPTAHIKQWKHNREFVATIAPTFPDWAVTAIFYTALHAIDALLKHDNVLPVNHDSRNNTLMRTNRYMKIWKLYQPLYNLSRTVRYLAKPEKWVSWDEIQSNVIGRYLHPIEGSVENLMQSSQSLPPLTVKTSQPPVPESPESPVPAAGTAPKAQA